MEASNANGEAHVEARGRDSKPGHLAIQLGFANSIRAFCETLSARCY